MIYNFRGSLPHDVFMHSRFDPHLVDGLFTYDSPEVPSSVDYKLDDLIAAGVKVAPVSTEVVHDASSVDSVIDNFNKLNSESHES